MFASRPSNSIIAFLFLSCLGSILASPVDQIDLKAALTSRGINASFPGDASYALASSAYNLRFTFQPVAITFPKHAQEISEIIQLGAAHKLTVAARSGGHSYIANGLGGRDGALVVDLQHLSDINVDATTGVAVIESGNRLGDIAATLGKAGRALPHGVCPYVGIGGHAGHGGFGFSSRMWGLTLDRVVAVNVVLANGTITRVNAQSTPDLFWALRGSASSFGITTSLAFSTLPSPPSATIFQYDWDLPSALAARGISAFQSFVHTDIPAHLGGQITLFRGPSKGTLRFSLNGAWYAPVEGLESVLAPLLRQMPGAKGSLRTGTYLESATILVGGSLETKSAPERHDAFYAKSLMTPESVPMSEKAIGAFVEYLATEGFASKTEWFVQLELYGGTNSAINDVPVDATAFAHRSSTFTIQFYASAPGMIPPFPEYGFAFMDKMVETLTLNSPADWDYGAYPNYIDDHLPDWRERYYGAHYARLVTLKEKYDPDSGWFVQVKPHGETNSVVNLRFTFQPAAITFPKHAQEISEIIQLGAAHKLTVAARGGGHGYIANGLGGQDGALVVDLQYLSNITVGATTGVAVI
ncbi:hypothetical protein DXG01_002445 [Tephrocybe rancida]|nr:hypothetical protein DXG01_002445 [Tephrocybe rancida]